MTVPLPRKPPEGPFPSPDSGSVGEELGWLQLCGSDREEAKGSLRGALPFPGSLMGISWLPVKTGAKYFFTSYKIKFKLLT